MMYMCVSAEVDVEGELVCGKCEVTCAEMMDKGERDAWFSQSSDRFYYIEVGS